jgi:hypothetical protein
MHELLCTIRAAAAGRPALPAVLPRAQAAAAARLEPDDHPIFAMRLAGTAPAEIADTLGLTRSELADRTAAILGRLARPAQPPERDPKPRRPRRPLMLGAAPAISPAG